MGVDKQKQVANSKSIQPKASPTIYVDPNIRGRVTVGKAKNGDSAYVRVKHPNSKKETVITGGRKSKLSAKLNKNGDIVCEVTKGAIMEGNSKSAKNTVKSIKKQSKKSRE